MNNSTDKTLNNWAKEWKKENLAEETARLIAQCSCSYTWDKSVYEHPCHGKGHTCKKPASQRLYNAKPGLAGAQVKFTMDTTWACDDCWNAFKDFQSL
jgi:hypothetical protein